MAIHQTAIVDPRAEIDPTVEIGPYVVIEGPVRIAAGTRVYPHVFINGWTQIGANCAIHPGAVVGHLPQDLKYEEGESYCRIGDDTVIREGVTIHRGTQAGSATVVGRRCFIMAGAHVGHNCHLGDDVKLANAALLGGHVGVGDGAFLSAGVGVHQFVRIGALVMVGGHVKLTMDVPPYFLVDQDGECLGVNSVGLRRAGLGPDEREDIKRAYRILYRSEGSFSQAIEQLAAAVTTDSGRRILAFVRQPSKRGLIGGRRKSVRLVPVPNDQGNERDD